MIFKIKYPISTLELLQSLFIYFLIKKTIKQTATFSYKVLPETRKLVSFPKGPFAHKKSKEQYYFIRSALTLNITSTTVFGVLPIAQLDSLFIGNKTNKITYIYY